MKTVVSDAHISSQQFCQIKEADGDNGIVGNLSTRLCYINITAPSILRHRLLKNDTIFNALIASIII